MIVAEDWIIGYDARVALHSDTPNVMDRKASADTSIWASVFDQGDYPDLSRAERERIGFGTLPLPEWTGINHPFWESLQKLEEYLRVCAKAIAQPYWIVAVTGLVAEIGRKENPDDWPRFEQAIPKDISKDWRLLGYDVNSRHDEDSISWIFSCDSGGQKEAQSRWVQRLNPYGLFDLVEDSAEFRESQDRLTSVAAPYFVRGLWIVREVVSTENCSHE